MEGEYNGLMPGETLSSLRAELESERVRLGAQIAEMSRTGADKALTFDEGFADSGQVTAERSEVDALSGNLSETMREVEDALSRIDAGTYGACESCGKEISPARLEAKPAARFCINCASNPR